MTKREYKRAAKAACEANGLKIPMIHMTLLEAGGDQYGALYVMFSDKRTGKEYQCRRDRQDWTWSACECEQTTTPETPAENETKGEKTTMTKKEMNATVEALENAYTNSITDGESPLTTCKAFIETVGAAAASQCMAVMVRRLHWDGRISKAARAWADGVQVDEAWSLYQVEAYTNRIHSSHLSQLAESMGEALEQVEAEAEAPAQTEAKQGTSPRAAIDALIKDLVKIQLEELILDSEVAEDESRTEQERTEAAQRKQDTIKTLSEVYNVPQSVLSRAIEISQDIDHDTYDVEASKIMDEIKQGSQDTKGGKPAPALTIERVAEALAEIQSMEPSGDSVTYYLHVTASGEIVSDRQTADQTLTFSVPLERYGITGQEENPQKIYDTETMSNPIFAEIVQNLTEQANLWLEQENHSEKSEPERAMYSTIQEALSIFDELSKDGVHTIKEDVSGEIMTGTPADLVQRIIEQDKRTAGNINHSFSTVEGAAIIETAYAISDGEAITTDDGRHIWNPRRREAGDQ